MRPDFFVAVVVYYSKHSKNQLDKGGPAIEADVHMEKGTTEAQVFDRLKEWCVRTFGEPCAISKEK